MATYPYTAQIGDPLTGFDFLVDIEVEIEASIEWDGGEPRIDIGRVFGVSTENHAQRKARMMYGVIPDARETRFDMMAEGGFWKHLALEIIEHAEADDDFLLTVLEGEEISFVGHPNDPSAKGWRVGA